MTTCFGKSFTFCLLCVSYVSVYQFVSACFFPFWCEDGMRDMIVPIPAPCISIYFDAVLDACPVNYRNEYLRDVKPATKL